jgi:hypothetical protein
MIGGDPPPQRDEMMKESTFLFITGVARVCVRREKRQTK